MAIDLHCERVFEQLAIAFLENRADADKEGPLMEIIEGRRSSM